MTPLQRYVNNIRAVLHSWNNPLKRIENVTVKDQYEKEFYDMEAQPYLDDFKLELFLYDENERFPASHRYFYTQLADIKGKNILDCCCGYGFSSVKCAKYGAKVTGIDISPKMLELAQRNAELNQVTGLAEFKLMSAQDMEFADNSFDYVIGQGALHHLNLELAGKEIARVLKPGGKALFIEPRIPFKWLIFIRSLIPTKCLESPGGAQLSDREIEYFSRFFSSTHVEYFIFLTKLTRFPLFKKISGGLEHADSRLSKRNKFLRKLYWAFVLEFTK